MSDIYLALGLRTPFVNASSVFATHWAMEIFKPVE